MMRKHAERQPFEKRQHVPGHVSFLAIRPAALTGQVCSAEASDGLRHPHSTALDRGSLSPKLNLRRVVRRTTSRAVGWASVQQRRPSGGSAAIAVSSGAVPSRSHAVALCSLNRRSRVSSHPFAPVAIRSRAWVAHSMSSRSYRMPHSSASDAQNAMPP